MQIIFPNLLLDLLQNICHLTKEVLQRQLNHCVNCELIRVSLSVFSNPTGILMRVVPVLFVQRQVQAGTFQTLSSLPLEAPAEMMKDMLTSAGGQIFVSDRQEAVVLPWVQTPQALCSTGSSNLWKIGRKCECCRFKVFCMDNFLILPEKKGLND